MHAVFVTVKVEDVEAAQANLRDEVVPRVKQAPGFVAGYWTRSEDSRRGMSMVVFESEDAANGAAQMIQTQLPEEDGVTLEGVEVREVVANA